MPAKATFPGGFTVLMAVHAGDDDQLLDRAVRSVFANTLLPDAFLMVVDGPVSSRLVPVIEGIEREFRPSVLRLPSNQGLAVALNSGLARITTEWVVRADADDFNVPGRFEALAQAVTATPSLTLLGSAILEVTRLGKPLAVRRTPMTHSEIVRYAKYRNPFNHMTVAFRRAFVQRCGGYPRIHLKEDYALWASMLGAGAVARNLAEALVHATAGRGMYRRRGGLRYACAEIELQQHLVQCHLKSSFAAYVHGVLRGIVFMLPALLRGWIYSHLLRSRR